MEHPSKEVLLRFILGTATRPENRLVVRHLLARCPACAATLQQLRLDPLGPPPSPEDYNPSFHRAEAAVLPLSHKAAPPPPLDLAAGGEVDPRPDSAATVSTVLRRWLFG